MKLKTKEVNGETVAVIQDGKPVYVADDGAEKTFDYADLSRANAESAARRKENGELKDNLAKFSGISDPQAAIEAIDKLKTIDQNKLVAEGKLDEVRQEVTASMEAKYKPIVEERDGLKGQLDEALIGGAFASSKYIAEKIAVPVDMVRAQFGGNFTIQDGAVIAKDGNGNVIYGTDGQPEKFDVALNKIIDGYAGKDHILKGSEAKGGGTKPSHAKGGNKTISRADWRQLEPGQQAEVVKDTVIID